MPFDQLERLISISYERIKTTSLTADSSATAAAIALGRICHEFDLSPELLCEFLQLSYSESRRGEVN